MRLDRGRVVAGNSRTHDEGREREEAPITKVALEVAEAAGNPDVSLITDAEIAMVLDRSEEGRKRQGKGFMTMERHTNAFDAAHRA